MGKVLLTRQEQGCDGISGIRVKAHMAACISNPSIGSQGDWRQVDP